MKREMQMNKKNVSIYAFTALLVFVFSCITINVYFPAAAVQDAANKFVEEVQSTQVKPPAKNDQDWMNPDAGKTGNLFPLPIYFIRNASAQSDSDISINTPLAENIKSSIKERFPQVAYFKDKGAIGENNRGILAPRDIQNLPMAERGKMNQVMSQENGDRIKLYMEVLRANSYPQDKLEDIKIIFAKSWQQTAKTGWWIQDPSGNWKKK
jgi:hypothetical protein